MDFRSSILWWAVKRRVAKDRPFIIAITGSIAKTSTKVAIGAVLGRAYPSQVRVGFGNLNSFLGVPLAILDFKVDFYRQHITWQWLWLLILAIWRGLFTGLPKYLVLEFGADYPGDIEQLAKMLPLDGAIITLIGPAHLANYLSIEAIAEEKAKILTAIKPGGWALVNKNDPYLNKLTLKDCPSEMVATKTEDIAINFARAVGEKMEISTDLINDALAVLPRSEGRLQLKDLGSVKLLDDSYNANPLSMAVALKVLAKLPGRKVAILGDMLELGVNERKFHQEIGRLAAEKSDLVIGIGQLAKEYDGSNWYPDSMTAANELLRMNTSKQSERLFSVLREGDTVLVKGSHGVHMEIIAKAIEKNYKK